MNMAYSLILVQTAWPLSFSQKHEVFHYLIILICEILIHGCESNFHDNELKGQKKE